MPRAGWPYSASMQDAAYKNLFSHPRMVEDLLRGFAARGWSERLDFSTLERLPAEFVSDDLRQRRGDGLWRVRFHDDTWLYLVVHLEFQSKVDRYMAVRMLVYTGLLYQDLVRREALGPNGELPPVLPVVLYNGASRWTAAEDVAALIAPAGEALARCQPSQRYFLLDERVRGEDDLPRRNLVSGLVALGNSRSSADLERALGAVYDCLRGPGGREIRRSFREWIERVGARRILGTEGELSVQTSEEMRTMLAERVKEWTQEWFEEGREQGMAEERRLLCRQAGRKFGGETAERLSGLLDGLTAPKPLADVGEWIIDCDTGEDLLDRTARMLPRP